MNLLEQFANHIEYIGAGKVARAEESGASIGATAPIEGNIFYGVMPEKPDECICVFSSDSGYGGSDSGARIQVMTRARSAKKAYTMCQGITEALMDDECEFLAGDGAQVRIEVLNSGCGLGADGKGRELFSANYTVYYCSG